MSIQSTCEGPARDTEVDGIGDLQKVLAKILSHRQDSFPPEIQKLCFYADLYTVEAFGRRLSKATYEVDMYGPYSQDVSKALEGITDEFQNVTAEPALFRGHQRWRYSTRGDVQTGLIEARRRILEHVCERTADTTAGELERISKNNWLYQETPGGEQLDFEKYCHELNDRNANPTLVDGDPSIEVRREDLFPVE